jgi:hypothetical protein
MPTKVKIPRHFDGDEDVVMILDKEYKEVMEEITFMFSKKNYDEEGILLVGRKQTKNLPRWFFRKRIISFEQYED